MNPFIRSFIMFIKQISKDRMLFGVCFAPFISALLFRYGIPSLEIILTGYFNRSVILTPYYLLFDLLLCILTPYMFCFASSMVILAEFDENMARYMAVTPVGKKGYVISRLLFPAVISFIVSILLLVLFSLTVWPFPMIITASLLSGILCIIISLFIVSFSHNRVEGLALSKLAGLITLGLPAPFFIKSGILWLLSPLPSFWIARLCMEQNYFYLLPAAAISAVWLVLLFRRFDKKVI